MIEKIAQLGVMGFVAIVVMLLFAFLTVCSVMDIPGVRPIDPEMTKTLFTTLMNLVVGVGGIVIGRLNTSTTKGPSA